MNALTRSKTSEARRRILAALAAAEAGTPERLVQLGARIAQARGREAQARRDLEAASFTRAQLEGEQLAASTMAERQAMNLRHELAAGAPEEIATMQQDIAALVDAARWKAKTVLQDGYQGLDGRHPTLVNTNTDVIAAFALAARHVTEALDALKYVETPDLERLGPFAELSLPAAQLEAAGRYDDSGMFVARVVKVPAALAECYAEIAGVANPKPMLSPGEAREAERDAAHAMQQRWSGEPWR
jgi:hypothetical protein